MTVREYLIVRGKVISEEEHRYEVTGFSVQEVQDSIDDLKILYTAHDIYLHNDCYHEFRDTSHKLANVRCGKDVLVS